MSLAALALRHGRGLFFIAAACTAAGIYTAVKLPKGVYPEVTFQREQVVAQLAGAPVVTVLAGVTRPLETALASVPGMQIVRTRTIRGAVELSLFFSEDTDMAQAHSLVLSRLAEARGSLPPEVELTAERVLASSFPILSLNVEGPYPSEQLYEIAQYTLRPALSGLPGAGLVSVQSSEIPETQVLLDPARLRAAHLTVPQVADKLRLANRVQTVARIEDEHELALGVVTGEMTDPAQIGQTVVGGTPSQPLRIVDLGTVTRGLAPRTTVIRVDGKPGAILNVARRASGDILALDTAVRQRLAAIKPSLPTGLQIRPVYEQAQFVADAVRGVRDAVLFGALFAVVVLAIFLRDLRATLVAALSLPLSLGMTLLVLRMLDQTLNLMSLGGLAIAVGLVIDDAVVIVEAVHRHLEAGLTPAEAARKGTEELFWPVVGTTVTTVVVFLPLGLLGGVAGQFFASLSVALAIAVGLSLPVALAVLPAVAAHILRPARRPSLGAGLAVRYSSLLGASFARPWLSAAVAGIFVLVGLFVGLRLETGFLPEADEGSYVIDYFAPVGASIRETDAAAAQIEAVVARTPETQAFSRRLGAELGPPAATLPSRGDVAVRLKTGKRRPIGEIMDEQRTAIATAAPGLRIEMIQVLADMLGDLQGSPEPIEVRFFGQDPAVLRDLAAQAAERIKEVPGLVDLFDGNEGCAPELDLRVDPLLAGRQGLPAQVVGDQLAGAFLGDVATQLRKPDHLEDVRVRLGADSSSRVALETAQVQSADGSATLPVRALGSLSRTCPSAALLRYNQRNMVHVTARLSGTDLGSAVNAVQSRLRGLALPVGYTWELGGLYEQQKQSFSALLVVLLGAVMAVEAVLLFQLRSFAWSAAVLAAAPVALAAGVLTLWATRTALNVSSIMGGILLVGLVVKNGILMLDHALEAQERGLGRREAILEAARERLRPILMTTFATLAALLPLVAGLGAGGELHRPLAITVVGGLLFSTGATLFLVPLIAAGLTASTLGSAQNQK
ncbi:MAG TPA: efflux RND transporter permease subunit [Myxococcales bacterium]|nr:efflux RND transporter permease subunit [Myxococcales bacterium]